MYLTFKCLCGDKGDNVPGVNGIGPKRASSLIAEHGDVFDIMTQLPISSKYKFMQNLNEFGAENLAKNIELMDLKGIKKLEFREKNIEICENDSQKRVSKLENLLDEFAIATLKDRYMIPGEDSPQEAFARACTAFADDDAHAQRLYDYVSNLWFMFATPVLSNGGTKRGLPISCFGIDVADSIQDIGQNTENAYLSSFGGGIGGHWSDVRSQGTKTSKGSESTGVIPFIKVVDAEMLAFSQGVTRRGSYAGYMHITHPEVEEFLDIRKPTGGDINRKCTNLHHGVVISDKFMETIHRATHEDNFDDSWELIDPHSHEVKKVVSARTLWVKLLQNRMETGEPYLMFEDAVNADLPDFQQRKD